MKIKPYDHLETLIGSIHKLFLNARNKGIVKNKELSLLNLIYKLVDTNCYENNSTTNQEQKLLSLYYKILNKYSFLCKANLTRNYYFENNTNNTFIPECEYIAPIINEIFYWQEGDFNSSNPFIIDAVSGTGYLNDKQSDTYENFSIGKNINYNKIGRICFLLTEAETNNIEIRDVLDNVINTAFDITNITDMNSKLLVSKNVMSMGEINFKIKKL